LEQPLIELLDRALTSPGSEGKLEILRQLSGLPDQPRTELVTDGNGRACADLIKVAL